MNQTKSWFLALCALLWVQLATAQKEMEDQLIKEADAYFEQGAYLKAFPLYSQLVSLYPNHAEYTFKFGACAIYGDPDKTKAVRYLNAAINKSVNNPDVYFFLGKAYHLNYQFKDAITAYENYVRYAGDKALRRDQALRQIETCIYGANLLSNIQDITVISKTETDKTNFFRYFNLEAIGGKILTLPDALKTKEDLKSTNPGVIHYPGNGTTIYFSSFGKGTATGKDIYKAQVLADGTFSIPEKLKGGVNTKYDEDFCFMHSDGRTLYFASKGHNSMGGYDIFKSVFDATTGEFGPAVNLDFAINTPDDDIFYIADSLNQRAYFASARSSDQDHLNVYNVLVESTPLQIVYLKGMFVSEIDPEQHKVGLKVIESNAQRSVCEGASNNVGEYIVYVPKSGQYKFKVVTENSPTVHEVTVDIPAFDKPVALRQEMRLINEGGRERIIVNNYFEAPLQEDLSVLAAEMLRKKSALDVNAGENPTASITKTEVSKEDELRTFDENLNNAPIAAGFEGGSVTDITTEMKTELDVIQRFVQQSDTKRNNSLIVARKKQQETEALLLQAEAIRKSLPSEVTTDAEVADLRKLVELTEQVGLLQIEAQAALNTARAIGAFKESETRRAESLQASITSIEQANEARNYQAVVTALSNEKDRRTAIRNGIEGAPHEQMIAKTKSVEKKRSRIETELNELRENEKNLERQSNRLKESLNEPDTKKSEREAIQTELTAIETELTDIRSEITSKQAAFNQSEESIAQSYADAAFFKKVNDDSTIGLTSAELISLNNAERDALEASIAALELRVHQLEINDPKMLAMVGDKANTQQQPTELTVRANTSANESTQNVAASLGTTSSSDVQQTSASVEKPWSAEATELKSTLEGRLSIIDIRPELTPARAMLLRSALSETRERIDALEARLLDGTISTGERTTLQNLKTYEPLLAQDFATAEAASPEVSSEDVREMCKSVDADYSNTLVAMENEDISEIERAQKRMIYKDAVITRLENRQLANARALKALNLNASDDASIQELERLTNEDVQLIAAIENLAAEANHVTALKAAFEIENKSIIESDAVYNEKLQDQLLVGEHYLSALNVFESQLRREMTTASPIQREQLEIELQSVAEQRQIVEAKQVAYRHDLELTASAADPAETELRTDSINTDQVDELDPLAETINNSNTLRIEDAPATSSETSTRMSTENTAESPSESAAQPVSQSASQSESTSSFTNETEQIIEPSSAVSADEVDTATINPTGGEVTTSVTELETSDAAEQVEVVSEPANAVVSETTAEAEAKEIKEIFAPKKEVGSIFAYETAAFDELVEQHPKISGRLNNREELQLLNDEITMLEGEMDVTRNESGRRKLDAKAEQLYMKRAMFEIENAPVVADMTRAEYNDELSKANEMTALHREQLNERVQVRDEVNELKKDSESNMQTAEKLREQARPLFDDIERADYYRQAYALEAKAIDQQRQIQDICANLPMINKYSESQLAMLKTGTVPSELREESETTKNPDKENTVSGSNAQSQLQFVNGAGEANATTTVLSSEEESTTPPVTTIVSNDGQPIETIQQSTPTTTTLDSQSDAVTVVSTPVADVSASPTQPNNDPVENTASSKAATSSSETINESVGFSEVTATTSSTDTSTGTGEQSPIDSAVSTTVAESKTDINRIDSEGTTASDMVDNSVASQRTSTEYAIAQASDSAEPALANAGASSEGRSSAASSSAASANAADYYYSMPVEVVASLFTTTPRGIYSDSRPIPIDAEMPKGVYYKVQIGAFRNDIPQNLYDQFAPISGERLNTGITRYTAGFFARFDNARVAKQEIRQMGYGDAFVVAYRDGKRIPLYEAAALTDSPEVAAAIKAAFDNAASTANANAASVAASNKSEAGSSNAGATATSNTTAAETTPSTNKTDSVASPNGTTKATNSLNVDAEVAAELSRKSSTRTVEEIEQAASKPKNTQYYDSNASNAPADQVEAINGLFYTVQVGVFSKPVAASLLKDIDPLNSELTENNKIRYTTGQFRSMADAVVRRDEIRKKGIEDAFVVAYYNGNRISLSEADLLLKEKGEEILAK